MTTHCHVALSALLFTAILFLVYVELYKSNEKTRMNSGELVQSLSQTNFEILDLLKNKNKTKPHQSQLKSTSTASNLLFIDQDVSNTATVVTKDSYPLLYFMALCSVVKLPPSITLFDSCLYSK